MHTVVWPPQKEALASSYDLHVCMYVCMYVYVYMYICMSIYIHTHTHTQEYHLHMICNCVHIHVCMYVYYTRMYTHIVYLYVYTCMYACMYTRICIDIHTVFWPPEKRDSHRPSLFNFGSVSCSCLLAYKRWEKSFLYVRICMFVCSVSARWVETVCLHTEGETIFMKNACMHDFLF